MPYAAAERAGVERGDPLALRQLLTMERQVSAGTRVLATYSSALAALADEAVADDSECFAADDVAVGESPAGENSALVEHERQRRLASYQRIESRG